MSGIPSIVRAGALATFAVASGFLIGYPAEVGAAATIGFAAFVSLITTRDLAARAGLRAPPIRPVADPPPLEQLRQVDKTLTAAYASRAGVDRDLRPLFRSIAAMGLARRGVDLDRDREKAQTMLGEELWELVQAERPRGSTQFASGISSPELQRLIQRLEWIQT